MFYTKLYLYDSTQVLTTPILRTRSDGITWEDYGFRGTDLSSYVMTGDIYKEDITSTLDSGEITLMGYNRASEFDPETKFILDYYEDEIWLNTYHIVCKQDFVEQPILTDSTYYTHNISFYEPSVLAQKYPCDNMSATYKLKDVSLSEETTLPIDDEMTQFSLNTYFQPERNFGSYVSGSDTYKVYGKYFVIGGNVEFRKADGTEVSQGSGTKYYQNLANYNVSGEGETPVYKATYKLVNLQLYTGVKNAKTFVLRGNVSYDYQVIETDTDDVKTVVTSGSHISNDNLSTNASQSDWWSGGSTELNNSWILEELKDNPTITNNVDYYFRKYTDTSADTPSGYTNAFVIKADCTYSLTISLHEFNDNLPTQTFSSTEQGYKATRICKYTYRHTYYGTIGETYKSIELDTSVFSQTTSNQMYTTTSATVILSSAIPYTALNLISKAILNIGIYEKKTGYAINDINISNNTINSDCQYYVDPNFIEELRATQVIEDFYNQKNFWEMLCVIGNYIHCIPTIHFGILGKYCISFYRLGRTDQKEDTAIRKSINNYRGIDDYVSACTSYITNMVQLGGNMVELVAPKTQAETYLIYNDTATIEVSKPIIELLSIQVTCNVSSYASIGINLGATADLTPYVYEKNVYDLLSVIYSDVPNRGIALYYELGDNKIQGLNYQIPYGSTNEYTDYAIKKIIYVAYHSTTNDPFSGYIVNPTPRETGEWIGIICNDFTFTISYRTKDSVRQAQCRPDLRHFMKSSPYDKVPTHSQFNNQQDLVIDSVAFGNNVYGKLIKSGNSNYEINEWESAYSQLKHKGELYKINGDLYYVAQATHYHYPDHWESHIVYSKDYNELSPIIGIPSEPRFYEISEQSTIRREVDIDSHLVIGTKAYGDTINYFFTLDHIVNLMWDTQTDFARWVLTTFKGDINTSNVDITLGVSDHNKDIMTPLNAYTSENTLTYSWDMVDNFSAGDKVVATAKTNYNSLRAVQYCDKYGKSALFDFYIFKDLSSAFSVSQIKALPESPIDTSASSLRNYANKLLATNNKKGAYLNKNTFGLSLFKDCREALSFNFNVQLLTDSDTFIVSPFVFLPNKKNIKVVLLNKEVNKLNAGYIDKNNDIITPIDTSNTQLDPYFSTSIAKNVITDGYWSYTKCTYAYLQLSTILANVNNGHFTTDSTGVMQRVKAIALICNVSQDTTIDTTSYLPTKAQFIIARNIPDTWTKTQAITNWYLSGADSTLFTKKQ